MRRKQYILPQFVIALFVVFVIFISGKVGILSVPRGLAERALNAARSATFFSLSTEDEEVEKLRQERDRLLAHVAEKKTLEEDNKALRDQFEQASNFSLKLLPARVVGVSSQFLFIDKGTRDGVQKDDAVTLTSQLIGSVSSASYHIAKVRLVGTNDFSTAAYAAESGGLGVLKAERGQLFLDTVSLPTELKEGEVVLSKGDLDIDGRGIPPDMVLGTIESIDREKSALFQKAKLKTFFTAKDISRVFVVVGVQ